MLSRLPKYIACVLTIFSLHSSLAEVPVGKSQYQSGVELLKVGDEVGAFNHFKESMELGYPDAFSASGYFYANGRGGVEKDDTKAFEFFQKGADLGSQAAQVNLARFYLDGRGVNFDREKGLALMEAAASAGSEDAHAALAEIYFVGLYDPEAKSDFAKARPYVQSCADRGSPPALNMLGLIYKEGHGVPVNLKKSEELFRQAAMRGDFKAQSNLGDLLDPYAKKKSRRIEAAAWLMIASRQGEPLAVYRIAELQAHMDAKEWEKATVLADELQGKIQP